MLDVNSLSPAHLTATNQLFNTQNVNSSSSAAALSVLSGSHQNGDQFQQQQANQNSLMAAFSSLMPTFMNAAQLNSAFLNVAASTGHSIPACSSPVSSASSTTNNNFTSALLKTMPSSSVFREENNGSKYFYFRIPTLI